MRDYSNELYHHGVLGMRWGKRKTPEKQNSSYSSKQQKRDIALYGKKGAKRINREMNKGNSVQGARHYEVKRQENAQNRKRIAKKIAKGTAAVTGIAVSIGIQQYETNPKFREKVNSGTEAAIKAIKNLGSSAKFF